MPAKSSKIVVLENLKELTVKLCQNLSFNKVTGFRPGTLLKRDFGTNIFRWTLENLLEQSFYWTALNGCFCMKKYINQAHLINSCYE